VILLIAGIVGGRDESKQVTTTDPAKAAAAAAEAPEAQRKADDEAARKANEITYSVTTTGSGILSVTYMKPNFNITQETNVKGKKWSKTIQDDGSSIGINMNAQNKGGGTITCTISRGGQVIAENSSSGEYAVVSCR
jgi:Mycobacterium membrane protein